MWLSPLFSYLQANLHGLPLRKRAEFFLQSCKVKQDLKIAPNLDRRLSNKLSQHRSNQIAVERRDGIAVKFGRFALSTFRRPANCDLIFRLSSSHGVAKAFDVPRRSYCKVSSMFAFFIVLGFLQILNYPGYKKLESDYVFQINVYCIFMKLKR